RVPRLLVQGCEGNDQRVGENVRRFKRRIRELAGRSRGISLPQRLAELRRSVQGWTGYFALAAQMRLFEPFDQWLRGSHAPWRGGRAGKPVRLPDSAPASPDFCPSALR
ncbi:MAG: group II intron maturase-specific domain-containing protein, partial [Pirellulaceae bacterium]